MKDAFYFINFMRRSKPHPACGTGLGRDNLINFITSMVNKMKKVKIIFLIILLAECGFGTIRYVSKTGSCTPPYISWETASDSIQKCINICVDGDTVIVTNGVYKERIDINTPIYLLGTSMDSTIIDGTGLPNNTVYLRARTTVDNFTIIGIGNILSTSVIIMQARDAIIRNCHISNATAGIGTRDRSIVENNIFTNLLVGINSSGSGSYDSVYIINNLFLVPANPGRGISVSNGRRFFIHNNVILSLTRFGWFGILIDQVQSAIITNNLISGFKLSSAYDDSAPRDSAYLANNVFSSSGQDSDWGSIDIHMGSRTRVLNNIIYNSYYGIYVLASPMTYDYNLFYKNIIDFNGTVTAGPNTVYADPMFVKEKEPTTLSDHDFHLQKYSPGIDAGNPSILDVDGSRSDIGLFGGPLGQVYTYQDLAPKPPGNVTAQLAEGKILLKWNKNTEGDFFRYRVYRDTVENFIYDTTKIIAVVSDTFYVDNLPDYYRAGTYYYKITAIDSAINQSPASEEVQVVVTGAAEGPPIAAGEYKLLQNYPNPFNPSTVIPYRLKDGGYVKIMVYNLLGEVVKVLQNGYQNPGYYEVEFSPTKEERRRGEGILEFETFYRNDIVSGIYLYRIEVIGEGNIPRFIDMKKMMMIK